MIGHPRCRDADTVGCLDLDKDKAAVRPFVWDRLEDDIRVSPDSAVGLDVARGSHQDHEDIASAPVLATRWDIGHLQHTVGESAMVLDLIFVNLKKATRYQRSKSKLYIPLWIYYDSTGVVVVVVVVEEQHY